MRNDRSVTFSISAATLNTADTTAVTLATFPDDGVVRVPDRLEIRREAGTAYTITLGAYPKPGLVEGDYPDSYSEGFRGGEFIQIYEGVTGSSSPRTWFQVKADGFLDSATEQDRIAFPQLASREFKKNVTSLILEINRSISGGTGSLVGTLFWKDYGVTVPIGR